MLTTREREALEDREGWFWQMYPAGQHILRVSRAGERDDERVIEVREGGDVQVIQATLKTKHGAQSQPTSSQGMGSSGVASSLMPGIVACNQCGSKFAEGVQFCGRCGHRSFSLVSHGEIKPGSVCPRCSAELPGNSKFCGRCGLNAGQTAGAVMQQQHSQPTPSVPTRFSAISR